MTPIEITYNTPVPIDITLLGVGTKGDKGIQGIPGATYDDTLIKSQLADNVIQLALKVNEGDLIINAKDYGIHSITEPGFETFDSTIAMQSALDATYTGLTYMGTMLIPKGIYIISATLNVPQGVTIYGYGAILKSKDTTLNPLIRVYNKISPTAPPCISFNIFGLTLNGDSYASRNVLKGIDIDSNFISGDLCTIRDCNIQWFQIGIQINNGNRMIVLDNCKITTKTAGVKILANTGVFVGDSWLRNCQIECETGICIEMSCIGNNSKISGIRINESVLYGVGIYGTCDNTTAHIQDVFIDNVAIDGVIGYVPIISFKGSTLQLNSGIIQISNIWLNSGTSGIKFEDVYASYVNGGKISSIQNQAFIISNSKYCNIKDINFYDCNKDQNGGGVIKLTGSSLKCKVLANNIFNSISITDIPIVIESGTTKCIIKDNTTDTTTPIFNQGTNNIISDNLGV